MCFNILLLRSRFVCPSLRRSCDFLSGPLGRKCSLCDIRILPLPAFFFFFSPSCGNLVWLECCFIQISVPPFPWEAPSRVFGLIRGNLRMFVNTVCGCWNQRGPALQTFRRWIFIKSGFSPETDVAGLPHCSRLHVLEFGVFFASVGIPLWANSRLMQAVCAEAANVFTCTSWYLQPSLLLITEHEPQTVNEMTGQQVEVLVSWI